MQYFDLNAKCTSTMKHFSILLPLFIFFSAQSYSQNWDIGTRWIYETLEWGPPVTGNYLIYEIEKDTQLLGEQFFQLNMYIRDPATGDITYVPLERYLQHQNDQVYLYHAASNTKKLIYDFGLMPGESFTAYCDFDESEFTVGIDSIGIIQQNGVQRRVQYVNSSDVRGCYFSGTIIEGVGSLQHLFPTYTSVDPPPGGEVVCYADPNFSYPVGTSCDALVGTKTPVLTKVEVFPNPTTDELNVDQFSYQTYRIYDLTGKEVQSGQKVSTISTAQLPAGMYMLFLQGQKDILTSRFMKE